MNEIDITMKGDFFYDFCKNIVNAKTKDEREKWLNRYDKSARYRIYSCLKDFYFDSLDASLQQEIFSYLKGYEDCYNAINFFK